MAPAFGHAIVYSPGPSVEPDPGRLDSIATKECSASPGFRELEGCRIPKRKRKERHRNEPLSHTPIVYMDRALHQTMLKDSISRSRTRERLYSISYSRSAGIQENRIMGAYLRMVFR